MFLIFIFASVLAVVVVVVVVVVALILSFHYPPWTNVSSIISIDGDECVYASEI